MTVYDTMFVYARMTALPGVWIVGASVVYDMLANAAGPVLP